MVANEGILNVDKPAGITSHDVVDQVRRLAGTRRVGHAGTLDPLATGVLLLCLGRATRLVAFLVGRPKVYETRLRLGQATTTYDAEGEVTAEAPADLTETSILAALPPFRGPIQQVPPMYSAVKRAGQPLYRLARQGLEVTRAARPVTVYELHLVAWEPPWLDLRVICSAGTYIRSLAHDLGQLLGCGAHVAALRRTAVGDFTVAEAWSLASLTADTWARALAPADRAVAHLNRVDLTAAESQAVLNGQRIARTRFETTVSGPDQSSPTPVRAYGPDGVFLGLLRPVEAAWQPLKMFPPLIDR